MSNLFWIAIVCGSLLQEAPVDPSRGLLQGDLFHTRIDFDSGLLSVETPQGESIVEFVPGVDIRPGLPVRAFRPTGVEGSQQLTADSEETIPARLLAALFHLSAADVAGKVTVIVRSGPYGPVLIHGIPRSAFTGLAGGHSGGVLSRGRTRIDRAAGEATLRLGGVQLVDGITIQAPERIQLDLDQIFPEVKKTSIRFSGRVGVDDSSPAGASARLVFSAGGAEIYASPALAAGDEPLAFDVPLRDTRELVVAIRAGESPAGGSAVVVLQGATFHAGEQHHDLDTILHAERPGIDFLADELGASLCQQGWWRQLSPDPAIGGEAPASIDLTDGGGGVLHPPPLLLLFEKRDGWLVGIGLAIAPGASRFAWQCDRIGVDVPTVELERQLAEEAQLQVPLAVVVGRSREQVARRYRETLNQIGGAAATRSIGSLTVPEWWRRPLLLSDSPADQGSFSRYDSFEVSRQAEALEQRLGVKQYTLVLRGRWNELLGDPGPAGGFSNLRGVIAAQHVRGRKVILGWDPVRAEPGSLADSAGILMNGLVDCSSRRQYQGLVHEVVRRSLSDQFSSFGADGLLMRGFERIPDPASGAGSLDLSRGVGFAEIRTILRTYRDEVDGFREDALILAPCGSPQFVQYLGGLFLEGTAPATRGWLDSQSSRARLLTAVMPDLPIYVSSDGVPQEDLLRWAAHSLVLGVPAISSRSLEGLDDERAAALGAILRLAPLRPLGLPELQADGRFRMGFQGRTYAENLLHDRGVVVYPDRRTALLALTEAGDVLLPFAPTVLEEGTAASVEIDARGALFRGGRSGEIYRFRLD